MFTRSVRVPYLSMVLRSDGSTVVIEYIITQSKPQSNIISIEQFLDDTFFGSCSIFLDAAEYLALFFKIEDGINRSYKSSDSISLSSNVLY